MTNERALLSGSDQPVQNLGRHRILSTYNRASGVCMYVCMYACVYVCMYVCITCVR